MAQLTGRLDICKHDELLIAKAFYTFYSRGHRSGFGVVLVYFVRVIEINVEYE